MYQTVETYWMQPYKPEHSLPQHGASKYSYHSGVCSDTACQGTVRLDVVCQGTMCLNTVR